MLATPWPSAFSDPKWAFEPKWDGVRIIARGVDGRLISRSGRDVTATYPELVDLASTGPIVLDGEIVAFDSAGVPSFELLQQRINVRGPKRSAGLAKTIPVHYLVFDLLFDDGPIFQLPWRERRHLLEQTKLPSAAIISSTVARSEEHTSELQSH